MAADLAVQCEKLLEWLLARRAIPENYTALLLGIGAKVNEALEAQVQDETAKKLISEHRESMTYFAARDVYEALAKSPEGQGKSLLGAHTHPGVAKWKVVLDAHRRKHLGWASEARLLIQNVSYEIPALKKQATACERQVLECTQRQAELLRTEENAKKRYETLLQQLGIEGFDPRRELVARAKNELPQVRAELESLLSSSGVMLVEYYRAFAEHAAGESCLEGLLPLLSALSRCPLPARVEDLEQEVPALRASRDEARNSGKLRQVQDMDKPTSSEEPASGGIDWGAVGGTNADTAGAESSEAAAGGIDWNFEVSGSGDAGGGGGINWDVEVSDGAGGNAAGTALDDATTEIVDAGGGGINWSAVTVEGLELREQGSDERKQDENDSSNTDEGLLGDSCTREMLYQEVAELGAFLRERCYELAGNSSSEDQVPEGAQKSLAEVQALAKVTAQAEELLAGRATQRLLMLRMSKRYLDQQIKAIEQAKAQCVRPVTRCAELDKVKAEQVEEGKRTRAEINKLRSATKKAQGELESEFSVYFKSAVRIVGNIAQI